MPKGRTHRIFNPSLSAAANICLVCFFNSWILKEEIQSNLTVSSLKGQSSRCPRLCLKAELQNFRQPKFLDLSDCSVFITVLRIETRYGHFIQFRYMPSYGIYFVFLIIIHILPVTGISIFLLGSQVKNKHHLHSRHLASYFVYWSELEFLNNL